MLEWLNLPPWMLQPLARIDWEPQLLAAIKSLLYILMVIILTQSALRLLKLMLDRIFPLAHLDIKKEKTLSILMYSVFRYAIYFLAMLMVLSILGVPVAPLFAGAGIAGLAIGFGAQSLVKDIITGFFIIFEEQYHVGDFVEINQGIKGTVEEIGLRMTKIREWGGHLNFISNSEIRTVRNYNRQKMRAIISYYLAYDVSYETASRVAEAICRELVENYGSHFIADDQGNLVEPPHLYGLVDIEDKNAPGAKYTIIGLVKDQSFWFIQRELRRLILER
ncbi:MAG TPA: mechanosensitive ion channel family protein, partial [Bacillota bacterium]|nr:mechanosensitive ion channel family protein [Bacillota bacterium]